VKLPLKGRWYLVLWRDVGRQEGWHEADDGRAPTIEVTAGLCMGRTPDRGLLICPTASFRLDNHRVSAKLGELDISIGCIVAWHEIPPPTIPDDPSDDE
jgi:hypothetical protein